MSVLDNFTPTDVMYFFEEICNIPHGSRNTKLISDYVVSIAKRNNLKYIQDESNNVIVYKNAVYPEGMEKSDSESAPVILQGHLDMVCEKDEDADIDLSYEPLRLMIENGMITADGTTLGGDDGIAVAYMLAILDSRDIPHPPLECVFTVDEEIGMLGAAALDMSVLKGRTLLNIDSEEEGELLVSCAGGATVTAHFPIIRRGAQGDRYKITISGLTGGHSGVEIDKGRANADKVIGSILSGLFYIDDTLRVIAVNGGLKDNAIPVKAEAFIITRKIDEVKEQFDHFVNIIKNEYEDTDPGLTLSLVPVSSLPENEYAFNDIYPLDEALNLSFILAYESLPNGVIKLSEDIEGLVQTSLNLGIMKTFNDEIQLSFSVRSSVEKEKKELIENIDDIVRSAGGYIEVNGEYPAWQYKKDSKLQKIMTSTYEELFNKPMVVKAIHAGVECGLFAGALDGLDAVSFGPDILDIHTPKERLSIESVERTWEYIKVLLKKLI